jgi:hypothetical protein
MISLAISSTLARPLPAAGPHCFDRSDSKRGRVLPDRDLRSPPMMTAVGHEERFLPRRLNRRCRGRKRSVAALGEPRSIGSSD